MSARLKDRLKQLKFISSMFSMAMDEFNNVMGPETIQTIFRLIGERQGEDIENRLRKKYHIDKWTPELFAEKLSKEVIDSAVGTGASEVSINGNELSVLVKDCPFKRAGIKIANKFYCEYTLGLIETAAKKALNINDFKSVKLRAVDNCDCSFLLKV